MTLPPWNCCSLDRFQRRRSAPPDEGMMESTLIYFLARLFTCGVWTAAGTYKAFHFKADDGRDDPQPRALAKVCASAGPHHGVRRQPDDHSEPVCLGSRAGLDRLHDPGIVSL